MKLITPTFSFQNFLFFLPFQVNKHALETFQRLIPRLAEPLAQQTPIIAQIIDKLGPCLASKNAQIHDLGRAGLDLLSRTFDTSALLQVSHYP